ncbi:170aa long hypothetical protein [Pyrococcus horikoshii OT3]|uniref:Uncharacterized protein n=1 Tax=Pyrococcus horikoshii (strain ATCC 700860 / DSM 12428 / JCM 9974 / NBRC 100139 / OT-3) TaxID=70601 RepID=O58978_PYRHO|nr:170aa long hypothetical protein [Pyrococcus horikoshii OT3]
MKAEIRAIAIAITYILTATKAALFGKNVPARKVITVILATQGINGLISIVKILSFSSSSILVAITAGTLQPNAKTIGIIAFPGSLNTLKYLSITAATLARYPLSSNIDIPTKRRNTRGKKLRTVPTPPIIPSTTKPLMVSFAILSPSHSPKDEKASSKSSCKGPPTANTN